MDKPFILLYCLSLCLICEAGKILIVIPTPSISHQVPFRPLTLELVKRGHEVTVITTDPIYPNGQTPENLTEISLHDESYKLIRELLKSGMTTGKKSDMIVQMTLLQPIPSKLLALHMTSERILNLLKNNKFDLLILEEVYRPFILYTHILKGVPIILVSSFGVFNPVLDVMGAPTRPALLYPNVLSQKVFPTTLWEKIEELYSHYTLEYIFACQVPDDNKTLKTLWGEDTPTISELEDNVDLLMLNVHPMWYLNRPVPPSVVYIGGINQKPDKELPKDLKKYLDESVNGVVFVSFGTNVLPSMLPPERIQILINVFSKLPYDVLWKWDKDQLPGISSNVKIFQWLPQSDLLKHPKLKLFITQGGLQSTDEAILAGVPLIGMPMLVDQWFNVEQYVHHKIGVRLDLEDLSEDKLLSGISTVINGGYRKNVERLRSVMYDQPESALSRAVWWTEHVLRHGGGKHLRAPAANLSWAEYLDIELLAVLAAAITALLTAVATVLWFLIKLWRRFHSYQKVKPKLS